MSLFLRLAGALPLPAGLSRFATSSSSTLLLATIFAAAPAFAHVGIDPPAAEAGAAARVSLSITHGCGRSATKAVMVHVPPAFLLAKAKAKPGWTASSELRALPQPVTLHGRTVTETAAVVRWQGGRLPHDQFDDFVLAGRLAGDASGPLAFRVVQVCDEGEIDWQGEPSSPAPAPVLKVLPARGHHHH